MWMLLTRFTSRQGHKAVVWCSTETRTEVQMPSVFSPLIYARSCMHVYKLMHSNTYTHRHAQTELSLSLAHIHIHSLPRPAVHSITDVCSCERPLWYANMARRSCPVQFPRLPFNQKLRSTDNEFKEIFILRIPCLDCPSLYLIIFFLFQGVYSF